MKAVRQIIDYLRGQGVLTRQQIIELALQGFIDDLDAKPAEPDAPPEAAPPDEADEEYEATYRTKPEQDRKQRHVLHKGAVLDAAEIAGRLADRFRAWEQPLGAVLAIGRRLVPCADWGEAAVAVRNAGPGDLWRALARGLAEMSPSLHALWESIDLEDYRLVLAEPELHGPAVTAYRAALTAQDHTQLGRHVWLLKEEPVAQVFNLRLAQRHLLQAVEIVLIRRPEVIAAAFRRDHHPAAYWALVLLYTARRGHPGRRPPPQADEHRPARALPGEGGWLRAWAQATVMNPEAVAPFLVEYHDLQTRRPGALASARDAVAGAVGTAGWMVSGLYFAGCPEGEIAARQNLSGAQVAQTLAATRQAMARAIEADPVLQRPFLAAPPHLHESLIDACLESGSPSADSSDAFFGPAADLLCPRSWD
jgi:hypothetical protein